MRAALSYLLNVQPLAVEMLVAARHCATRSSRASGSGLRVARGLTALDVFGEEARSFESETM